MAKIEVKNLDGAKVGDIDLDDSVFGVEVNEHLLWEVVKAQRAKKRTGTASTLRRNEVRGGGKKPWKQKGTGRARSGSSRSPIFVGGGKVFTPKPRDYEYNVPKKVMAGALRSALSLKAKESKLVVVEGFKLDGIKTKRVVEVLKKLGAQKPLIVDAKNETLAKSARNLVRTKYLATEGINVYDVLDHDTLVLTRATVEAVTARLKQEAKQEEGAAS